MAALKTVVAFGSHVVSVFITLIHSSVYVLVNLFNKVLDNLIVSRLYSVENTAQVGRILWRNKMSEIDNGSKHNFLCIFLTRVPPDYVLKPNVSLYNVTKSEAIFVETAVNCCIYSSEENSFLYAAQFIRAKNVITMPIRLFHALAEKVGDPTGLIWISNIGRCGSTLLCQVFEYFPRNLVLSEPDATLEVYYLRKSNKISEEEYENMLSSTVRLLCKPYPGKERAVIKTRSVCIALMTDISKLFPKAKHIFMYRNCQDTVLSFLAAATSLPSSWVMRTCIDNELLSTIFPFFRKNILFIIVCQLKASPEIPSKTSMFGILVHTWANYILVARDAMSRDPKILPVKYEDLLSNPAEVCKMIFENMDLDPNHVEESLSIFSKDSQRSSFFNRNRLKGDRQHAVSEANRIIGDAILSSYGLPRMGEDFRI